MLLSVVLSTSALQALQVLQVLQVLPPASAACTCPPATLASQVCGSDQRTYGSRCLLDCAAAGLSVAHPGPCLAVGTMSWLVNASLLASADPGGTWSRSRRSATNAKSQYDSCKNTHGCDEKTCSECSLSWKCQQKCIRNCWCECGGLPGSGLDKFDEWEKCFAERDCWGNHLRCNQRCQELGIECMNDCSMRLTKCDCECNQQGAEQTITPLSPPSTRPSSTVSAVVAPEVSVVPHADAPPTHEVTTLMVTPEVTSMVTSEVTTTELAHAHADAPPTHEVTTLMVTPEVTSMVTSEVTTTATTELDPESRTAMAPEVTTAAELAHGVYASTNEGSATSAVPGSVSAGHGEDEELDTDRDTSSPSPRPALGAAVTVGQRTDQGAGPPPGSRSGSEPGGPSAARVTAVWEWAVLFLSVCAVAGVSAGVCVLARARSQVICCVFGQGHHIVHGAGAGAGQPQQPAAGWTSCRSKGDKRGDIELTSFNDI